MEGERRWLARSTLGCERLIEWVALLLKTTEGENEEVGVISWGISGLQEPVTTFSILARLVEVSELNDVSDVLGTGTHVAGRTPGQTNCVGRGTMTGDEHASGVGDGTGGEGICETTKVRKLHRVQGASSADL